LEKLQVIYLGHSGFLVEMEQVYFLFDYYKGDIPILDQNKKLFIFVSHKHQDHYNRDIWNLKNQYEDSYFIISKDVPFSARQRSLLGISEEDCERIIRVHANKNYLLSDRANNPVQVYTLKSTDIGVAYLVTYQNCNIYHAGDLNRWIWREETDEQNRNMAKNYSLQIDILQTYLKENKIMIAFLPLDPRQGEEAYGGVNEFLEKIKVDTIFPMHLWEKYNWIEKYIQMLPKQYADKIIKVKKAGQEWILPNPLVKIQPENN